MLLHRRPRGRCESTFDGLARLSITRRKFHVPRVEGRAFLVQVVVLVVVPGCDGIPRVIQERDQITVSSKPRPARRVATVRRKISFHSYNPPFQNRQRAMIVLADRQGRETRAVSSSDTSRRLPLEHLQGRSR